MLHYSATGVAKTNEIKISRPVMALLITANIPFSALANEVITVDIERNQGSNTNICNVFPLAKLATLSGWGIPAVHSTAGGFTALIPLADGSIPLAASDSIKVNISGLDTTKLYSVASVESPEPARSPFRYEQKVVTSDEINRLVEVQGFNVCQLDGISSITQVSLKHRNGTVNKYEIPELTAISQADDLVSVVSAGLIQASPTGALVFNCSQITEIEIVKNAGTTVFVSLKA